MAVSLLNFIYVDFCYCLGAFETETCFCSEIFKCQFANAVMATRSTTKNWSSKRRLCCLMYLLYDSHCLSVFFLWITKNVHINTSVDETTSFIVSFVLVGIAHKYTAHVYVNIEPKSWHIVRNHKFRSCTMLKELVLQYEKNVLRKTSCKPKETKI